MRLGRGSFKFVEPRQFRDPPSISRALRGPLYIVNMVINQGLTIHYGSLDQFIVIGSRGRTARTC